MKYSIDLKCESSKDWINTVMSDFDAFLQDHADCERKASAMAMSFVAKYPDRKEIISELIETAVEELEHFQQVYAVMQQRGIQLNHEIGRDPYVYALLQQCRSTPEERFMDRLLLASIVECRGAERFHMVADALQEPELKKFYKDLWTSEAKHGNIFVRMALNYFDEKDVYKRLEEMADMEAEVLQKLELRAALH